MSKNYPKNEITIKIPEDYKLDMEKLQKAGLELKKYEEKLKSEGFDIINESCKYQTSIPTKILTTIK